MITIGIMIESSPRSSEQVVQEFHELGLSISEWARSHGFSAALAYQVLSGRKKCLRGQSHQIAVALGLKAGRIGTVADINAVPRRFGASPTAIQLKEGMSA